MNKHKSIIAAVIGGIAGLGVTGYGGYYMFAVAPEVTGLTWLAVSAITSMAGVGAFIGAVATYEWARSDDPVAEIAVEEEIRREQSPNLIGQSPPGADDLVEAIETADENEDVSTLLVTFNTPGGEIVPSEDIARAVEEFDGLTIGYARDLCASGGYHIASACDRIVARENALVGSIGVLGSRVNYSDLADELGVSYEQFTAGDYKDAGMPMKDMDEDERSYIQSTVDGMYDAFVETVAERRGMDVDEVRDTEAKIFRGADAAEIGLVDSVGSRDDVENWIEDRIPGENTKSSIKVTDWTPTGSPFAARLGAGSVAYAFGAGIADQLGSLKDSDLSLEYKR